MRPTSSNENQVFVICAISIVAGNGLSGHVLIDRTLIRAITSQLAEKLNVLQGSETEFDDLAWEEAWREALTDPRDCE